MDITWTKDMSVGDELLDSQHMKLLCKITELKEEIAGGKAMGSIRTTIDFFEKYVLEHLNSEEVYMKKHNYPKFREHKKLHGTFVTYFNNFKEEFYSLYRSEDFSGFGLTKLLSKTEKFFEQWWVNHIMKEDHKYAIYVKNMK